MKRTRKKRASRRRGSKQRKLSRIGLLFAVLAGMCVVLAVIVSAASLFSSGAARQRQLTLGLVLLAAGGVLFLLRWVVRGIQTLLRNRRTRRTAPAPYPAERVPPVPHAYGYGRERPGRETSDQSGVVLILTLVVLALVAGLVVQSQVSARFALRQARAQLRRHQLQIAAGDAVRAALRQLAEDPGPAPGATNFLWDSSWDATDPAGISTWVRVTDENRYFDLNNLAVPAGRPGRTSRQVLLDLLTLCGDFTPVQRVEALADWIDPDEDGFRERAFYQEETPPYRPSNRVLQSWGELLWVDGFDRELFAPHTRTSPNDVFNEDLLNCVTMLPVARSQPVPINLNTAGRAVLLAVFGLEQDRLVDTILSMRALRPIPSMEPVAVLTDPDFLAGIRPFLEVKSQFFRVEARAYLEGQAESLRALVHRSGRGEVEILQWMI